MSPSSTTTAPRVFISYSHDSPEHALRVLELADTLRRYGVNAWIDQYEVLPAKGWHQWMVDQIAEADFVLVVCSETYRRRFELKEVPGRGKGVAWEGAVINAELYEAQGWRGKFLPVVFAASDLEYRPVVLRSTTHFVVVAGEDPADLLRALAGQPGAVAPPLGEWRPLAPPLLRTHVSAVVPGPVSPAIQRYKKWAFEKYSRLELVGLGAAEFPLSFDDVYVPLRVDSRLADVADFADHKGGPAGAHWVRRGETLDVDLIFRESRARHAMLLGEPGSGKTTALKKLHRLVVKEDPRGFGFEAGTLPVFLRLRRLGKEFFGQSLRGFLAQELEELGGKTLPPSAELAMELFAGPLLLLLDGLDEIGDLQHRSDVCRYLSTQLSRPENSRVRVLLSCRRSGFNADLELAFDPLLLEVRPLEKPQIEKLVHAFFREAGRIVGTLNEVDASNAARKLVEGIVRQEMANERVRSMVSTPLLLTLLCVVVFRGEEIPRQRVSFYEKCLGILLGPWRKEMAGREPPVEVGQALQLLEELAIHLHREGQREGLTPWVAARLWKSLIDPGEAGKVFQWLYQDAGVLTLFTERSWGFVHLGLQEYLAAQWLKDRETEASMFCKKWVESWWQEVLLQLAALGRRSFVLVVREWLKAGVLTEQADLFRQCLVEAKDPDYEPFLEVLRTGTEVEQAAVLRLLRGRANPKLLELAERLAQGKERDEVRMLAEELCRAEQQGKKARAFNVAFLHDNRETDVVQRLREALQRRSLDVYWPEPGSSWRDEYQRLYQNCRVLVLVMGPNLLEAGVLEDAAGLCDIDPGAGSMVLQLPTSRELVAPAFARAKRVRLERLDQMDPLFKAICQGWQELEAAESQAVAPGGENIVEPSSGETFLQIPGGEFVMGGNVHDDEKPPHRVWLSSYYLARTPVTNEQYRCYLEKNPGVAEPGMWRDSRFNSADQPVVGVSWEEAAAYCAWLPELDGLRFHLPSEAQWEFAARGGSELREYPWAGKELPSERLASFGRPFGSQPVGVGSFPAGAARWGQLDLAGNVWEWCLDDWTDDYSWCSPLERDPCNQKGGFSRILRGGAFWSETQYLRAACRGGNDARRRDHGVGFRVAASPRASLPSHLGPRLLPSS